MPLPLKICDIFNNIPFARLTINEVAAKYHENKKGKKGLWLNTTTKEGVWADVFPRITMDGVEYDSHLRLLGVGAIPGYSAFESMTSLETTKALHLNSETPRGALVVTEQKLPTTNRRRWIFNIFIQERLCPDITDITPSNLILALRTETFATEFLCAVEAYEELSSRQWTNLIPVQHPSLELDVLPLIAPDEELFAVATEYWLPQGGGLLDIIQFYAEQNAPADLSLVPQFWNYWSSQRRVSPHRVGCRMREMEYLLRGLGHKFKKNVRPISTDLLSKYAIFTK